MLDDLLCRNSVGLASSSVLDDVEVNRRAWASNLCNGKEVIVIDQIAEPGASYLDRRAKGRWLSGNSQIAVQFTALESARLLRTNVRDEIENK
jgi:hypothetical protein